jgi:glycine cleavage system aminomethyltransferase T
VRTAVRKPRLNDAPTAQSALHQVYVTQEAEINLRDGWTVPTQFGSVDAEVAAARTAVAVGELFGVGVIDLVGEELAECASRLGVGDVPIGVASPVTLSEAGEGRWLRLTRAHARLLIGSGRVSAARAALDTGGGCLHVTDVSSGLTTLAVTGARCPDLLARLVRVDVDPRVFADRRLALTGAVGVLLQILRWDRGPLLAYELTVGRDVAEYFWDALMHAGEDLGLTLIGDEALSKAGVRQ